MWEMEFILDIMSYMDIFADVLNIKRLTNMLFIIQNKYNENIGRTAIATLLHKICA